MKVPCPYCKKKISLEGSIVFLSETFCPKCEQRLLWRASLDFATHDFKKLTWRKPQEECSLSDVKALSVKAQLLRFITSNPGYGEKDFMTELGKSRSTIHKYLKQLLQEGKIETLVGCYFAKESEK